MASALPSVADVPADPAPPAGAPDWSSIDRSVICPLCDYDLRGLAEPRCPECGYAFAWPELLDPNLAPHPWLFEHHPRRNVLSFLRTLRGTVRARRFWKSIAPTQPISVRRLMLYWFIVAIITFLGGAGGRFAALAVRTAWNNTVQRKEMLRQNGNPPDPYAVRAKSYWASVGTMMDAMAPLPKQRLFWRQLWQYDNDGSVGIKIAAAAALWPGLTMLTLTIFVATFKRARIKRVHVLRCAIYCGDVFVAMVLLPVLVTMLASVAGPERLSQSMTAELVALLILAAIACYRLSEAFREYLRFPHPGRTALAVQGIVALAVVVYLLQDWAAWRLFF